MGHTRVVTSSLFTAAGAATVDIQTDELCPDATPRGWRSPWEAYMRPTADGYARWLRRRHPLSALAGDLRRWWRLRRLRPTIRQ